MESRKISRVVLATLIVTCACFSTTASAHHGTGHVVRDILLAPLLLPAAIIAASTPPPVFYHETYYARPQPYVVHHGPVVVRHHDVRRYEVNRNYGNYGRHVGQPRRYR